MAHEGVDIPAEAQAEISAELAKLGFDPRPDGEAPAAAALAQADAGASTEAAQGQQTEPAKDDKTSKVEPPKTAEAAAEEPKDPPGKTAMLLRAERKKLEARAQRVAAQAADLEARGGQVEKLHTQLAADAELAAKDPLAWLAKRGISGDELAHRLLTGKAPAVDTGAKASSEVEQLRQELKAMREERASTDRAAQQAKLLGEFVGAARAGADRWPLASQCDEQELRDMGLALVQKIDPKTPRHMRPSDEDLLDKIEERLGKMLPASARAPTAAKAPAKAPAAKPAPAKQPAAPTLAGATSDGGASGLEDEAEAYMAAATSEERHRLLMRILGKTNGAAMRS